jgi:hypothetical protein
MSHTNQPPFAYRMKVTFCPTINTCVEAPHTNSISFHVHIQVIFYTCSPGVQLFLSISTMSHVEPSTQNIVKTATCRKGTATNQDLAPPSNKTTRQLYRGAEQETYSEGENPPRGSLAILKISLAARSHAVFDPSSFVIFYDFCNILPTYRLISSPASNMLVYVN